MVISTVVFGWIGIITFIAIIVSFRKLAMFNEYGFIHILMAIMYGVWLPIPIVIHQMLDRDLLIVGTTFGMLYLVMLVITMVLQTGHIVHLVKQEQTKIWEERGNYMMSTLSSPFEPFANVFKSIWALFLSIAFWQNDYIVFAILTFLSSLFIIYFFIIMLNQSMVTPMKRLSKIKPNLFIFNLETLAFFTILLIYMTIHS